MKLEKNKRYKPSTNWVIEKYEFYVSLKTHKGKEFFFPRGNMNENVTKWLTNFIGEMIQDTDERSWAASSVVNPGYYFTDKEDAVIFVLTWAEHDGN